MSTTATNAGYDVARLRALEFPWLDAERDCYLNSASSGPLPARSARALEEWIRRRRLPHRIALEEQLGVLQAARRGAAALIGADEAEIALATNTSDGINLAARAMSLKRGDVIVASDGEFPANVYPWMAAARATGAELRLLPAAGAWPDEAALLAALDDERVRVLAVSWVAFSTGYRVDLARLGAACRARDVMFVVDAIQGVGAQPLDVHGCDVDVLACGAQKWLLSPWGTGFTYVRRELQDALEPPGAGWLSVRGAEDFSHLTDYDFTWCDDARRYEVGTLAYEITAAMAASVGLIGELTTTAIAAHVGTLTDRIVAWAHEQPGVRLLTPPERERRAGIIAFVPTDPAAVAEALRVAEVAFSLRGGAIRLAPHAFNTMAEVEHALEVCGRAGSRNGRVR